MIFEALFRRSLTLSSEFEQIQPLVRSRELYVKGQRDSPPREYTQSEILDFLRGQQVLGPDYVQLRQGLIHVPSPHRGDIKSEIPPCMDPVSDAADIRQECIFVCEAAAQRRRILGFRRGNYQVAQAIGLFLKSAQSAMPDDPSFDKQSFGNFLFWSYVALHTIINTGDIKVLSDRAVARIGTANREVHRWVVNRKMNRLSFLEYELPRAFAGMSGNVWCLWIWVFQEVDSLFRFVEFGAAALIILIPTIEALGIPDMDALTENNFKLWKELAQALHYETVQPLAQVLDAMK
jgi:hypothetical protein